MLVRAFVMRLATDTFAVTALGLLGTTILLKPPVGTFAEVIVKLPPEAALLLPIVRA